jgi:hypothetical protein
MKSRYAPLLVVVAVIGLTNAPPASAGPPPLGKYDCEGFSWYGQLKIKADKHYRFDGKGGAPNSRGEFKMTAPKKFRFTSGYFHASSPNELGYRGHWYRGGVDDTPIIDLIPIPDSGSGWQSMFCEHA